MKNTEKITWRKKNLGCFSWLDCVTGKQIAIGDEAYVLVPKKFREQYGVIHTGYYDGYGNFGGHDVYELVAEWNREELDSRMLKGFPKRKNYGGLWDYEKEDLRKEGKTEEEIKEADEAEIDKNYRAACNRWTRNANRLKDYRNGFSHEKMVKLYGADYLREIGIDIACYDDQNSSLPYPIKISHDGTAVYEECRASLSDPDQGCC